MNPLYLSYILAGITVLLIAVSFFINNGEKECYIVPYLIIAILIGLVYFYKIGEYPWGLNIDEAGAVYDGINIAKYGTDRYMNSYPMYFINFGGGQNALFTYVFAGWYKLLTLFVNIDLKTIDINTLLFIVRIPTLIINIIAYLICFLTVRKEYGNKVCAITMLVVLSLPFSFMHSRFSLESYYLYPMLLIALSIFVRAIRTHSNIQYIISGIFFGLSLYTYAIAYAILPILLAGLLLIIIYTKNFNIRNCISFLVPLIFISIPIILFLIVNYFNLPEMKYLGLTITKLPMFRSGDFTINNIDNNLFHLTYFKRVLFDQFDYNSFKEFSTIFYMNIPLLLLGFIISIKEIALSYKERIFKTDYVAIVLLIACILTGLLTSRICVNKAHPVFISISFYIVKGYIYLFNKNKIIFRIIILLLIINYISFINYYYSHNQRNMGSQSNEVLESLQESIKISEKQGGKVYSKTEFGLDKVYFGLFSDLSPEEYKEENIINKYVEGYLEEADDNSVILIETCFNDEIKELIENGYKNIDKETYKIFYK